MVLNVSWLKTPGGCNFRRQDGLLLSRRPSSISFESISAVKLSWMGRYAFASKPFGGRFLTVNQVTTRRFL